MEINFNKRRRLKKNKKNMEAEVSENILVKKLEYSEYVSIESGEYKASNVRTNFLLNKDEISLIKDLIKSSPFIKQKTNKKYNFVFYYNDGIKNEYDVSTKNGVSYDFVFKNVSGERLWSENYIDGDFIIFEPEPKIEKMESNEEVVNLDAEINFDFKNFVKSREVFSKTELALYKNLMSKIITHVKNGDYRVKFNDYNTDYNTEVIGLEVDLYDYELSSAEAYKFSKWVMCAYKDINRCDVYPTSYVDANKKGITVMMSW